jgi:hypothetical protein
MQRIARMVPVLIFGVVVGCQDERDITPPSFAAAGPSGTCPANPTVIVSDDTLLRAALRAARPGDVIAVNGTIEVTRDDSITVDNVTLTCATPGSGLVAASFDSTGSQVADMITVTARGVVVENLVLDGFNASDSPVFAVNDGATALAQDVRFSGNNIKCARFGSCVFIAGGTGAVVSDNQIEATDALTGIHIQANGPDPTVPVFPIRVDGARVERNSIVALTPSFGRRFGAIRPFDANNFRIANNVISGPWRNGISPARFGSSEVLANQITGVVMDGILTSSFGGQFVGLVARNLFSGNQVSGAGRSGVFAHRACANQFTNNDLRGNAASLGMVLDDTTGGNVVAGVENDGVVDNGTFDCDGDGTIDPNVITGSVVHHQPMPPDTTSAPVRKNQGIVIL